MAGASMEEVAPRVFRIPLQGGDLLNAYLLGDVLIDSGAPPVRRRLFRGLEGRTVRAHAITHAHFDHLGCSHAVCSRLSVPFMCGEGDAAAVEAGEPHRVLPSSRPLVGWLARRLSGPPIPVERRLREGDEVGGFTVLESPGHTPGHLAFWREPDGVLILGDVAFNRNPIWLRRGLEEPFRFATFDPALNRESARRLASLNPRVICFGHGLPLRDGGRFKAYVASLPDP